MAMSKPPVVLDNGTGYTKMGYAGNYEPNFIIPSVIATVVEQKGVKKNEVQDLDFYIGGDAQIKRPNYNIDYPIREGQIKSWDNMEKFWQRCIYEYMSCDPEEHFMLLTEPPMNTPENREYTAEIMFETFNVPGLYIAVQAVLALCASLLTKQDASGKDAPVTGTVIDSGDGVTHIIPVVEGYVIGSCIKDIPMAGRVVTDFVLEQLRDRGEPIPKNEALAVAKRIKEMYSYVCQDITTEFEKYDKDWEAKEFKKFKQYEGVDSRGNAYTIDVGYERFLGPELFFSPQIFSSDHSIPLPELIDNTIQSCPIDTRRSLYKYITLSGGTTMFKNFTKRLKRDVQQKCDERTAARQAMYPDMELTPTEVNVITHPFQRFAVWFGGSMLASQPQFLKFFHTRAQYEDQGPRIARHNSAVNSVC